MKHLLSLGCTSQRHIAYLEYLLLVNRPILIFVHYPDVLPFAQSKSFTGTFNIHSAYRNKHTPWSMKLVKQ